MLGSIFGEKEYYVIDYDITSLYMISCTIISHNMRVYSIIAHAFTACTIVLYNMILYEIIS